MARKTGKKSKGAAIMAISMPSRNRVHASIEEAENGYVVNTSGHGKDGYHDKTHVAPTGQAALRIANSHLGSITSAKPKKKAAERKKLAKR